MSDIAAAPVSLAEALRLLPKVELHCHLEGTMRPRTLVQLARVRGVPLPADDPAELYRYRSLNEFLSVFWLVQSVLRTRDDWARLAYESVLDGAAAGRVYAECFFTPARHLAGGQRLADILAGLADGLAAGDAATGARTMLICDMDRAYGPAAGRQLIEELGELRRAGARGADRVLGIGMDSTELGVDPRDYLPAYRRAAELGLRRTGHQGEDSPPADVAALVDELGAERIDHGLSAARSPELVARLADRHIPLTMCPTSNVVIANRMRSVADHPLPLLRASGVLVTLNTDDPAMTDLDLAREFTRCAEAWGWGLHEMAELAMDGVTGSWLDPGEAAALRARIAAARDALAQSCGDVPATSLA